MERDERARLQHLMVRLAGGDRAAFDPVHALLWPLVRRFASRALNGAPEADDAAQTVMMKVFCRASELDVERDALSWVLGVAAFECKTFRQKRCRRREEPDASALLARDDPSPEASVIARDLEHAAAEVLGTLRPADADTLRAVMSGERPDIAAPTFRKRVERALDRLRTAWSSRHGVD